MPIEQLTPPEANEAMEETEGSIYLDVRTVGEFEAGHPAGALNVPVAVPGPGGQMQLNPDFLSTVEKVIPTDTPLFCGCQVGGRSQAAAEILERAGYTNLVNIRGGFGGLQDAETGEVIPGWQDEGLPVEAGDGGDRSYEALKKKANG